MMTTRYYYNIFKSIKDNREDFFDYMIMEEKTNKSLCYYTIENKDQNMIFSRDTIVENTFVKRDSRNTKYFNVTTSLSTEINQKNIEFSIIQLFNVDSDNFRLKCPNFLQQYVNENLDSPTMSEKTFYDNVKKMIFFERLTFFFFIMKRQFYTCQLKTLENNYFLLLKKYKMKINTMDLRKFKECPFTDDFDFFDEMFEDIDYKKKEKKNKSLCYYTIENNDQNMIFSRDTIVENTFVKRDSRNTKYFNITSSLSTEINQKKY